MIQMEADKVSSGTGAQFLSQLPPHTPQLTPLSPLSFLDSHLAGGLYPFQLSALLAASCTSFHHQFMPGSQMTVI